jgi:uncharacterized membrane protein (UPF0127 family)
MRSWKNCKLFIASLFCFFVLACQPEAAPVLSPFTIHTAKGTQLLQVEIARTPGEREKGLMFRKELPSGQGMLFIFPDEKQVAFWMRNTLIPLDMVYIQTDGTIGHIQKMAKPHDETPLPSIVPVIAVLEIYGGEADKRNIAVGDHADTTLLVPSQE